MKALIIGIMLIVGLHTFAGISGLPSERIALPKMEGEYLLCVWDAITLSWAQDHITYDNSGVYNLQIPEWNKWYFIGLWDLNTKQYVFSTWIGHYKTD